MAWQPRFSDGLYHHFGARMVDQPTDAEIDRAFRSLDTVPDLSGVEFFSGTTVTAGNAALVKRRLDERGLQCSMVHHGEPYVRGRFAEAAFTSTDASEHRAAIDMCLNALDIARRLDGPGIYVFVPMDGADYPFQRDFPSLQQGIAEALHEICEAAGDLRVALEYRPYSPRGRAAIGTASAVLDLIAQLGRPNLGVQLECSHSMMAQENLAYAAWDAARRGLLYHVHLNDTQLPQDLSTVFASTHLWESMEMLHWLREVGYRDFLGVDVIWWREDGAASATRFIRNVQYLVRVLDVVDRDELRAAMARADILATQELLWTALQQTS